MNDNRVIFLQTIDEVSVVYIVIDAVAGHKPQQQDFINIVETKQILDAVLCSKQLLSSDLFQRFCCRDHNITSNCHYFVINTIIIKFKINNYTIKTCITIYSKKIFVEIFHAQLMCMKPPERGVFGV